MQQAMRDLSREIITLQGEGDYTAVDVFVSNYGETDPTLRSDLDRINQQGIPVDIVFEPGMSLLQDG